ncbi:MAG: putative peptidoglycan glycosyltransferase FtsW [Candidatus Saccharimonadales bacterium]
MLTGSRLVAAAAANPADGTYVGRRHKPDYWLLIGATLLLTIGFIVVFSISPGLAASQNVSQNYFITKQFIDVVLGLAVFGLAARLPISLWHRLARPLAYAAILASAVVMFMPVDSIYQAHRWIRVGGLSFQVVELIKLALIIWLAGFLAQRFRAGKIADSSATIRPLLIILIAIAFVIAKAQSDLGSAGVVLAITALMAYVAGVPLKRIGLIAATVLLILTIAIASSNYRRERLATFLNPQSDCLGSGYQACQALKSVGSGGLVGLGLGHSVQAYGYLPEASNDSIFAIIAEKFGFIGSAIVVAIYAVLISRLKTIISKTADVFSRLVVVGVLAWFSTQMIINIGAMIGLLPLKGITLPLVSQGGTSIIFLTAALGVVFQISRYTSYDVIEPKNGPTSASRSYSGPGRRRLRRPYNPASVTRPRA